MTVIREFFALLGLNTDAKDFKKAEEALGNIAKGAAIAVAAVAAVGAAFALGTRDVVNQARELDKWNRVTGESIENLDALRIASESLGVDAEKTFEGMTELADRASDVILNIKELTGDAGESFKSLGFKSVAGLKKADGSLRDLPELFDDVLNRLEAVENVGERTGIAMRLFGDDTGLAIAGIPLDRLRELRQEALELGLVMSRENVEAAREFEQSTGTLFAQLGALRNQVIVPLLPLLNQYAKQLTSAVQANGEFIKRNLTPIFRAIARGTIFLIAKLRDYARFLERVVNLMGGARKVGAALGLVLGVLLAKQVGNLVLALRFSLVKAITSVSKAMLIAQLQTIAWGAGFILFALIVDEVITTLQGGESLINDFVKAFDPDDLSAEDNVFTRMLRLVLKLIDRVARAASDLVTIFTEEGPIQEAAIARLRKLPGEILSAPGEFAVQLATGESGEALVARVNDALADFVIQAGSTQPAAPGGGFVGPPSPSAPGGSFAGPPSTPQARGGGGLSLVIQQGDIIVPTTTGETSAIVSEFRNVVRQENDVAMRTAARELKGGS